MGKNTFTLFPGVEELVAKMIAPRVTEIAEDVKREAKRLAPGTKVWVTFEDGRVCDHCQPLHMNELPENLRFAAKSYQWDIDNRGVGEYTYLLYPRDSSAGANDLVMVSHCRCLLDRDPEGLSRKIHNTPGKAAGKLVKATVYIEGDHVVEAEQGTVYGEGRHVVEGAHFMYRGALNVARRRRGLSGGGELNPTDSSFINPAH